MARSAFFQGAWEENGKVLSAYWSMVREMVVYNVFAEF
jgi:hypothetical protein